MDTRDTANDEVPSVDIFLDFRVLHTLPSVCNSLRSSPRQVECRQVWILLSLQGHRKSNLVASYGRSNLPRDHLLVYVQFTGL
jgi:hypothetical protein